MLMMPGSISNYCSAIYLNNVARTVRYHDSFGGHVLETKA